VTIFWVMPMLPVVKVAGGITPYRGRKRVKLYRSGQG